MSDCPHIVRKRLVTGFAWYIYAWRGGPQVHRSEGPKKPKLTTEVLKAIIAAQEQRTKVDETTFKSLIRDWRSEDPSRPSSPEWSRLAVNTKKTWGSALNVIEARWGDVPLRLFSDPRMKAKVVAWRDSRATTPRAADIGVTVLSALLNFGTLRGKVLTNVATGIPNLYRGSDRAEIVWTPEDIDRFCWAALKLERPQMIDVIWLAALTGLRREDLATVKLSNVYEHAIVKKALKRSGRRRFRATMPRIPELDDLLQELSTRHRAEGVETLLVNSFGRPWSGDGLGGSFNRVRDEGAIYHVDEETGERRAKHLHDLRGTFCTRLISAGLVDEEVADIMAWSPQRVASIRRTYVDQSHVIVAIGERLAAGRVNQAVNR